MINMNDIGNKAYYPNNIFWLDNATDYNWNLSELQKVHGAITSRKMPTLLIFTLYGLWRWTRKIDYSCLYWMPLLNAPNALKSYRPIPKNVNVVGSNGRRNIILWAVCLERRACPSTKRFVFTPTKNCTKQRVSLKILSDKTNADFDQVLNPNVARGTISVTTTDYDHTTGVASFKMANSRIFVRARPESDLLFWNHRLVKERTHLLTILMR